MPPTQPDAGPERPLPHRAIAHVVPLTEPRQYIGHCSAKDFTAPQTRLDERAAEADVAEHLAEVTARPHGPYVLVTTSFLGICDAGDFTAAEVRASWNEAAADVAEHVAEMQPDEIRP